MKRYTYHGFDKFWQIINQLFGCTGILLFSAFGLFWLYGAIITDPSFARVDILNDPRYTLLCLGIFIIAFSWMIGSILINYWPEIWVNETGVTVSAFIVFRVKIVWSDIVDIGEGNPPWGYVLVRTRRITLFHRLIGWLYSRTLYPSFLIGSGIENYDNLYREIVSKKEIP